MSNISTFPTSALLAPGIYLEEIDPGITDIPAVTREIARAALDDIFHCELKWLGYELNTPHTRRHLVANLRGILTMLWVTDGLKGDTAQDAFFIRCNHTTTPLDFDEGLLVCEVGMAPVNPSEFVVFRILIRFAPRS